MYKTLIVVDADATTLSASQPDVISFEKYLRDYPKQDEPRTRIINLCDTGDYLSKGYYCSLLAEARRHTVLPSVKTINDLRALRRESVDIMPLKSDLAGIDIHAGDCESILYFGVAEVPELQKLANRIFSKYPAPLMKMSLSSDDGGIRIKLERYSFSMLTEQQRKIFDVRLSDFIEKVWRLNAPRKRYRWDMAILVDPAEKVPPSNREAIARFVKAASKHGIHAQPLSFDKLQNIASYDALFIRETTAIDHHTYRLANAAESSGLIVIDDPDSILRCCNKVYLHDAFSYMKVPSLKTEVVNDSSEETLDKLEALFQFPLVLKMPEGSFSKGVFKVKDRHELKTKLNELFQLSALVLAQEYLYTEFDWRIGVLNGRAIYACKYLMARNHWQIYNHDAKRFVSGDFETLPTFEVPKNVLDAALKAAKVVGNGLYGVDIKQVDKQAFVIEVNDNPSIDHKVEDVYLGDELYMQIMAEFQRRLELRGRQ